VVSAVGILAVGYLALFLIKDFGANMSVEFRARRTFLFVEPNAVELDKLKVQYVCDE
jgi:hypothetical protein